MIKLLPALLCLIVGFSCKREVPADSVTKEVSPNSLVVAFGSCNHQWEEQPIWDKIVTHQPDVWIWLGDIIYADTDDMNKMKADYDHQLQKPGYQRLLDSTAVLGIWDDHDYGANNSGKDYPKKDSSKALMFDFLGVPSSNPAREHTGAYQSYNYHLDQSDMNVKVILLDVRYFRDEPGENNTIIGAQQWAWFENELANSDADMHIIGGGSQFLPEDHRFEKWANYPKDRAKLIELLDQYDVDLPLLISGDRHLAEMSLVTDAEGAPILEVTSSGLTHSYRGFTEETNRHRVGGEVVSSKNYGVITIIPADGQVIYKVGLYDDNGTLQYELGSDELSDLVD